MTIDMFTLTAQVSGCTTLKESVDMLTEQLALLVERGTDPKEIAAALRYVPPANSARISLSAALTMGTSHLAVHPDDPLIPVVRMALESPVVDRPAHIASIKMALEQPKLMAAVRARLDAATATPEAEASPVT